MMRISRLVIVSLIFTATILMLGCAASGPAFIKIETIPEQKGIVYLYRSKTIVGGAIVPQIWCNGRPVVELKRGGYYPYFADIGENIFTAKTEARTTVKVDVEPGKEYYIKLRIGVGIGVGRPHLNLMNEQQGAEEIKN